MRIKYDLGVRKKEMMVFLPVAKFILPIKKQ
jgi:hypothetical protein